MSQWKSKKIQATTAPQEMAAENTETSEEDEWILLFGTLEALQSEESPQVDLQVAAEQVLNAEATEPVIISPHEPPQYATHESLTAEVFESTSHIYTELSDPFEIARIGLLVAKGHVDGYRATVIFDTGCIGDIISPEFCKMIGIKYHANPEYMSIMANQTLQETGKTTEPVTLSLGFYTERMKFIVTPRRYDVILDTNWKNSHKATIDCSKNNVNFEYAGNKYIIHTKETIKETSLGSLVNDYKNESPIFSVLLRNENVHYCGCVNKNAEFSAVLSEYSGVLPEELPKVLPPKRNSRKDLSQSRKVCTECPTPN